MIKLIKSRWYLFAAIIIIAIAGIVFYRQDAASKSKKIASHTVKRQNLSETLSLSGEIDASQKAVLRFQASGRLVWVGVSEGDYVSKYQGIASLDSREVRDNLQKYLNTYSSERRDFEQTKDDYDKTGINDAAKRILEKAQFDLNNSIIDVELRNLAIEYANLWTPIEGLVTHIDSPLPGVNITPTTAEFDIVNPKTIFFLATADQTDVTKLSASQSGKITLDSYPDNTINGQTTYISFTPKSGESGTVYEIRLSIPVDNSRYQYRPGMTGDVEFVLREKNNVLAVPTKYIKSEKGTNYVWLKTPDDKKVKQIINVGMVVDTDTEILDGLKEGDVIYEN